MLSRVRQKDFVHIVLAHHTFRHVVSILFVFVSMLFIISAVGAILHFDERVVVSPAKPVAKVAPKKEVPKKETPKPEVSKPAPAKTVDPPAPKHDYVIPPVVNNIPPVVTNFHTADPVVFLTIDDGAFKDPSVVKLLKDNNIKASLFLARTFIQSDPDFFKQITAQGSLIEDHTLTHNLNMETEQSYQQMVNEICGMADYEQQHYGRRPIFFRPPGGGYSDTMLHAAGACGMRAVVTWIAKANGGSMQYQIGDHLRPGDVVLMHFRPEFLQDLQAFVTAEHAAGLHTELLEDWAN